MSARPERSDSLARVLRDEPPPLDELTKARVERRLLERVREGGAAPGAARSRGRRGPMVVGAVVLLAAAAAVGLFVLDANEGADAAVASFELRDVDTHAQRGTLEAGSTLATDVRQVATVRVRQSQIQLGEATRLRISALSPSRTTLELSEGEVQVGFHPSQPGQERMTVETPEARVEVVGTVFAVRTRDGATHVSVSEGTVRVVPRFAGRAVLVHAGEETRVARTLADAAPQGEAALAGPGASSQDAVDMAFVVPEPELPVAEDPVPERPDGAREGEEPPEGIAELRPLAPSPESELARARALLIHGRPEAAELLLRRLARPPVAAPIRAEAWTLLADLQERRGALQEALRAYREAERSAGASIVGANAIYARARLEERRLSDETAARESYERYLEVAPDGALASQTRAALCRLGASAHCADAP